MEKLTIEELISLLEYAHHAGLVGKSFESFYEESFGKKIIKPKLNDTQKQILDAVLKNNAHKKMQKNQEKKIAKDLLFKKINLNP